MGILVLAASLKLKSFMFSDMNQIDFELMLDALGGDEVFRANIKNISQSIVSVESRKIRLTMKNAEESDEEKDEENGGKKDEENAEE